MPGYNVRPLEMSGAIGIEQLKKLPQFLEQRKINAQYFKEHFKNHPNFLIQQEIGNSSWFGFSLIIRPEASITRAQIVEILAKNEIECRPIVTGNFLKNKDVLKYFDYEVSGSVENANYLDEHGLFVGNHQIDLTKELNLLIDVLK